MGKALWRIEGYVTAAGGKTVQDWFWNDTTLEERDAVRDRLSYLVELKRLLWTEPYFKWIGDIGEIRKKLPTGALRLYGLFDEERSVFVLLNGVVKKKNRDAAGIETARLRMKRLKRGEGATHEFSVEEEPAGEAPQGPEGESSAGGVESVGGDRVPDQGN